MSSEIVRLNRLLASLGRVRGGTLPRFQWAWAPDLPYWSTRLDPQWVLTQWERPHFTEDEWQSQFAGRYPYPANGMYHALIESALPIGREPDEALTQNYVWALDRQMSMTFADQLCSVNNDMERQQERHDQEWVEFVQNQNYSALDEFEMVGYGSERTCRE